ncbi:hypothetical protein RDWZM_000137 [Blomia tropicalis]|uniref:Uncharacterized protein n=1 Tax=Blomia tropicalis TaxID=40697 RepID=A0A9Q0MBN0_BLOTA|nr:hypothetical protein RDWZM_000137 [Blomia tropicalis]
MFQNPDLIIENFTSRQDIDNNSTNGKKLTIKINNPDDDDPCDERCKEEYQKLLQMLDGMANKRVEQDLLDVIKLNKLNVTRHNDFITGIWELLWNTPSKVIKFTIIQAFYLYLASLGKARLGDLLDWSGNVIVPGHNDPRTTEKIIKNHGGMFQFCLERNTLPPKRKTRINDDFSWFFRVLFGRRQPDDFDHLVIVNRKLFLIFLILIVFILQAEVICCAYDLIRYERKFNNSSVIRMRKIGQRPMMEK